MYHLPTSFNLGTKAPSRVWKTLSFRCPQYLKSSKPQTEHIIVNLFSLYQPNFILLQWPFYHKWYSKSSHYSNQGSSLVLSCHCPSRLLLSHYQSQLSFLLNVRYTHFLQFWYTLSSSDPINSFLNYIQLLCLPLRSCSLSRWRQ